MAPALRRPSERECELCGRTETWDPEAATWRIATEDGERAVGEPYCVHEWDINGTFAPFDS